MSITNGSVVMLYIKTMKLQYELAFPKQSFVLASAVITPATQQALVPLAARFHVSDGNQGLRSHSSLWCLSLPLGAVRQKIQRMFHRFCYLDKSLYLIDHRAEF